METLETKNPLRNCRCLGPVDQSDYIKQDAQRGHLTFVMSRGELMEFNRCPHRWIKGYQSDDTKATEWGGLIDCLALTPQRFEQCFAIAPAMYQTKGMQCPQCGSITDAQACRKCKVSRVEITLEKEWDWNATFCKEWRDERDGLQIVKHDLNQDAIAATKVLLSDPYIADLLEHAEKQVMVTGEYKDSDTGIVVPLKGLIDIVPIVGSTHGRSLADLKTCISASAFSWTRAVFEHNYHVQAALYIDLYVGATGEERLDFMHALQESFSPWEVGKRLLSSEFIELGRTGYLAALKRYCQCLELRKWPGYDDEAREVINGWQLTQPEPWMIGRI